MLHRISFDHCPVDAVNHEQALAAMLGALASGEPHCVAPVNAATVVEAHRDRVFRAALRRMDILLPDGFWLRPAAWLAGLPMLPHTPTVPLTLHLLAALAARHGRVYLLGARPEVVAAAATRLQARFPGLTVAGMRDGYFEIGDEPAIIEAINEARPDLMLIGIASPKRDLFMIRRRTELKVPVSIGVGGLLDILGGKTPEGPAWLRSIGMMWLFRLLQEPRRLWKRYTVTNAMFMWLAGRQALSRLWNGRGRAQARERRQADMRAVKENR